MAVCVLLALWPSAKAQSNTQGQWSAVQNWGLEAVHGLLLPNGKLLFFAAYANSLNPQIWDPATNQVTPAPSISYEVFCGGHAGLANGQLFVSGGAITTNLGVPNASIYDSVANAWTSLPSMNAGRWYPTSTTLANGDILTTGGNDENGNPNPLPQVWSNASQTWVSLTSAQLVLQLYPRMFLAPNGQVFEAGPDTATRYLNTSGAGAWTLVGNSNYTAGRSYGSWVMYDVGKIIAIGGGDPPTNTAEIIDLTVSKPTWTYTNSMSYARRNLNATLLPDGTILVTGGSSAGGFDTSSGAVFAAELWDPATQLWTTLASNTIFRGYHSMAVLLPDGRVVSAGGNVGGATAEIFSPPYLFNGPQPVISSAPPTVTYGHTFFVGTPNSTSISQVNMLRLGAATHAFNQNQRINKLTFTQTSGGLNVTAPPDGIHCPPGYYMLFIINNIGVPSVASMIQIGTPPAATLSPTGLTFGSQQLGTSSSPQTVGLTVTYSGSSQLYTPSNISTTGDFSEANGCNATMIAGTSCSITITFTPTAAGTRNGTLTITDNSTAGSQTVSLTGTATGPTISLSPTGLPFGAQTQGVPSAPQTVTLTNTGTDILTINSITTTGPNAADFAQTNTCGTFPASIAAGANCTISVTFTPSIVGQESASLSISDNAPGNPHTVKMGGQGGPPAPLVTLSATSLAYGNQNVGSPSAAQAISLQNTGSATLSITSIAFTGTNKGDFSQTNTCGTSVAASASCTISVTFKPAANGARSASIAITDNATGSPQTVSLTGTGTTPAISLSPASLSFGNQLINADSAAQNVTVTNNGTGTLTLNSITSAGKNSTDFVQANTCGASVAAGTTCTISVTFDPPATGARSASLSISDNVTGSPQTIALSGTGVTPVTSFSTTTVSFGNQNVGTSSASQTVTLTNTGTMALTISNITLTGTNSGDFAETNTCGTLPATVAIGANCTLTATFTPSANGAESASINLFDNAAPSPQIINLTGTGTTPAVTLSTASLAFGNQDVATASTAQAVTLTNSGTGILTITSIALSGTNPADFGETTTCGATVNAGANCTINVTFAPTTTGSRSATVSITDNASGSPQSITLSGTGVTPSTSLSATSLTFSSQQVNIPSAAQTVTLTNPGAGPLNIAGITITGTNNTDFSQTNTCGTSVGPGANCTISVTFTPTTTGTRTASVSIADNAAGSPQTVSLTGTGIAPAPNFSSTSLTFSAQQTGTTSAAQTVTLTNAGSGTLTISSLTITGTNSGDFTQTNTCGSSVAANASCSITVTFDPTGTGTRNASVSVSDNATGSPQTVGLTGTGTAPAVTLSTASVPFGNQLVGTTSSSQNVTLQNTGTAPLTITNIAITGTNPGDFAQSTTCGSSVASGGSCTFTVTFTPPATGSRTASISITDNASGSPQAVSLTGTGTAPAVTLTPASESFGNQLVGIASAAQNVTLQNTGTATLNITTIAITGTNSVDFTQTNTCGSSVAASSSCTISVIFTPSATGARSGSVTLTDSASDSPQSVGLSGTGVVPVVSLSPGSEIFANQLVGTTSSAQTVTLQNTGTGPLNISSIAVTGANVGDFAQANNCGVVVAAGANCSVNVSFTPGTTGSRSASLSFTDNASGSPQSVNLSGTGVAPVVSLSPTSEVFGSQLVGTTSATQTVTLQNTGTGQLNLSSIAITGVNSADFSQSINCGNSVAPGGNCTINVSFAPTGVGTRNAAVTITDNASDSPESISLTGTGIAPIVGLSATSESFGSQLVGTTSATQAVTLQNTGTGPLIISGITITGASPGDFAQTNTCGTGIAAGTSCTFTLTFTPTATAARAATLGITDNAAGSPQTVALSGFGTANAVPQINNPVVPARAAPGASGFTLTVNGTGFVPGSVVNWNGSARPTGFASSTQLTATIQASDIAGAGTASVSVTSPLPGGGTSNPAFFDITNAPSAVFEARSDASTGPSPRSVVTADFNGDGKLDLAVANASDNTVSILLGNGDGTLQSRKNYSTGSSPLAVAVGDFNGDGALDLAVVNQQSNTVSILLGNGNGTFQVHKDYNTGSSPAAVAVGDFNGDGKLDLAVLNQKSNTVSVLLGNGDGTFQARADYNTGSSPSSIVVGDFNADGLLDLAVANSGSKTVSVLLGNGDGTFQIRQDFAAGAGPASVTAADFNGDGRLDLAVANSNDNTVSILLGNGDGALFQGHTDYAAGNAPNSVMAGDFNGDGILDLAATNGNDNTVSILLGNGNGTFRAHQDFATGTNPQSVIAGDFNGDGALDLAVAGQGSNSVTVLLETVASVSPAAVSFTNQQVGTTSASQTVTLQNAGSGPLALTNIAIAGGNGGDFAQTNACGSSIAAGGSCAIGITFSPTAIGARGATLTISDAAVGSPQVVSLTGTGIAPVVSLSTTSVSFGNQLIPTTSNSQTVTLHNTGGAALVINSIAVTGTNSSDFGQTNTCGSSVAPGASCTITLTFTPSVNGAESAAVTITDNALDSPESVNLTGTGTSPTVTLSPTSVNFPNQLIGITSSAQKVTLQNTGTGPLNIASIAVTGTNNADFAQTNTCGSSVAAGKNCSISITFTPSINGAESASITITDNASDSPESVGLSGTGVAPAVSLSATSVTFIAQPVGTSSTSQQVTLQNTGTGPLNITSMTFTGTNGGDFAQSNTCGSSVAAGASCNINITFAPTATGTRNATLNLNDNASGSPQTVGLTGTGIAPAVNLSPTAVPFGSQQVSIGSAAQSVTLQNTGTAPLSITSITITGSNSGDFAQSNTCGSSVANGASCTISVTFTPTATGSRSANVSIADNASGSPQTVSLTGTGIAPAVSLSPASVPFGNQQVSTTSAAQTVTLQNTGAAPLTVNSIAVTGANSGDFAQANTCGPSVGAGASCTISITFTPSASGARSAAVTISDNAGTGTQTVGLTGTGVMPGVSLSPASLTFPAQLIGSASAAQSVTLQNTGGAPLTITGISISGTNGAEFAETTTCGASLAAGASCAISVTFTPAATGTRTAAINVTDNAGGSPQSVNLTGTGTTGTPAVTLSLTSVPFPNRVVGTTSLVKAVTLTNKGTSTLTIASITVTGTNPGDFAETNTCGASVLAGAGCTINITFTPTAIGARSAAVSIKDNATGSPQTISLSGTGLAASTVSLTPTTLTFTKQLVGTTSATQAITLKNTGKGTLIINSIVITGTNSADFAETTTCGSTLAVAASCSINVTFTPAASGARSASVSITDDATGSPQNVSLTATGTLVAVTPQALTFPGQKVATSSAAQAVTVKNTGAAALSVSNIAINGTDPGDFSQTNTCGKSLAAGATCTISITFKPKAKGTRSAASSIADSDPASPQSFTLTGTGQ
jgi:hypothetical protein